VIRHKRREVKVADFIEFKLQKAAVALADTLNYDLAAKRLGITAFALKCQIDAFESKLCVQIFDAAAEKLRLTEDGRILIQSIREALQHKRR
jgi:DNA-binding transcriptional LysR family regulator